MAFLLHCASLQVKPKKAKALQPLELVAACQAEHNIRALIVGTVFGGIVHYLYIYIYIYISIYFLLVIHLFVYLFHSFIHSFIIY